MNQIVVLTGYEEKKTGESKRGPWALRLFTAAGGTKFQTFDVDLGEKAIGLIGQSAELEYELEENGNFQNNVIKSIKAANGNGHAAEIVAIQQAANNAVEDPRRSKEEMRRTEASKVAATLLAAAPEAQQTPQEVARIADLIALYFEQGASAFGSAS